MADDAGQHGEGSGIGGDERPDTPLPGLAGEIAEVIGRAQALRLIEALPPSATRPWRVCVYVPKPAALGTGHMLVNLLGWSDAEKLARHFGGEILQPGNLRYLDRRFRHRLVRALAALGAPMAEIVEISGYRERHVRSILAAQPPEDRPREGPEDARGGNRR